MFGGKIRRASASAIGERIAFMPHMNSTAPGRFRASHPACSVAAATITLIPASEHTDQREQPPRRIEIDFDLAVEPVHQRLRALVVDAAPAHVDRLDLARASRSGSPRNSFRRS